MKKIIIVLITVFLIFVFFQKFDFIFFKIKVCNNTNEKMLISVYGNKKEFFNKINIDNLLEKIFTNYKSPIDMGEKVSFLLKANTCSDFKNTKPFSNKYLVKSFIIKNNIKFIDCSGIGSDQPQDISNLNYGKYLLNIKNYKIVEYTKKDVKYKFCKLNYGIIENNN